MIRWNKFSLVLIGLCLTLFSFSQENLMDYSNSLKFAKYLSATNQYKLASQEYERINFLWPDHNDVIFELIHNYRLGGDCEKIDYCLQLVSKNDLLHTDENFSKEILRFSLNCKSHEDQYFKILGSLDKTEKIFYTFSYYWVNSKPEQVRNLFLTEKEDLNKINPQLYDITKSFCDLKYKKPWAAALMSSVFPGSGKAYSKRWGDALISFLFVSSNAFVSYRAFNKKGATSFNGWFFGGLAFSFYSANIWGSAKAAKTYNNDLINKYQLNAEQVIYNSY